MLNDPQMFHYHKPSAISSPEERLVLLQMGEVYIKMIQQLELLQFDHEDFKRTIEQQDHEMLMTNRLIKKEVIDIADLVEHVSKILIAMNDKIDQQDHFYKNVLREQCRKMDIDY